MHAGVYARETRHVYDASYACDALNFICATLYIRYPVYTLPCIYATLYRHAMLCTHAFSLCWRTRTSQQTSERCCWPLRADVGDGGAGCVRHGGDEVGVA
jgi:hypothetical protein